MTLPSSNFEVSVGNPTTSSLTVTVDSQLTNEVFVYAVNGKEVHRGKGKSYTASNLSANKSYTFTVWTENSAGDKTKPKSATGKTLPLPSFGGSSLLQPKPPVDEKEATHPNTAESQTHTDQAGFQDIDHSFAKEEILALFDMGIVKGVSNSKFEPDRQVTRVEFTSMLVRALEFQEASDAALTFEDVQRTAWYVPELSAAVLNGIARGVSAKEFRPFDPITREQAAKMIANAAYQGNVPTAQANYKDAGLIAWWAKPEVAALSTERVITGYPDQTFKPKRDLTRAECAVLIYRSLGLIK
ncbi:Endo-1,4-beta-xylanase A precursor [Paenibacillus sp. P1XP2]|nr:Endo-1,4-beta-xylanase A precursor [Paenibacillus sp. P1XP2]